MLLAPQTISGDYNVTLMGWIQEYRKYTFWEALGKTIGNYYVPYNIFLNVVARIPGELWLWITITSCLAEYVGAYYIYKLLYYISGDKNRAIMVSEVLLFLPVTILNGALWKQCDAIYTCFIILSLYYYFTDNMVKTFIFLAVGYSFKQQIIFIIPFFIIMYFIKKNYSILQFLWIPAVYIIVGLPCVWAQRGIRETYSVYLRQNQGYNEMSWLSNSFYRLGINNYEIFGKSAILITAAIFALALFYTFKNRDNVTCESMLMLAGWCMLTCYLFLPSMHERYDYPAIVIITAFVLMFRKKLVGAALTMNLCSMCAYNFYLFDFQIIDGIPFVVMSVIYLAAYFKYTVDMMTMIKTKN